MDSVAASEIKFSMDVYQAVARKKSAEENIFFSPFSISTALAMAYAGAEGNTEAQMKAGLSLTTSDKRATHAGYSQILSSIQEAKENVTLDTANTMYISERLQLLDDYSSTLQKDYKASAKRVDFSNAEPTRQKINSDVEELTRDKIKDLLPSGMINADTRMVLVNAVYFKGEWLNKFDDSRTTTKPFHVTLTKTVDVNMMRRNAKYVAGVISELNCKALEIPYQGNRISMLILLPDRVDGLPELERKLATYSLHAINQNMYERPVEVELPRLKLEQRLTELKDTLIQMGMSDMFDARRADFSGITGDRSLFVSEIVHKAFIEVNEKGTEAAAATAVVMFRMAAIAPPPEPIKFIADHPYVFFMVDTISDQILFMGRVASPSRQN